MRVSVKAWWSGWLLITTPFTVPRIVTFAFLAAITLPPGLAALVWWCLVPTLVTRLGRRAVLRVERRYAALGGGFSD